MAETRVTDPPRARRLLEVFGVFLRLGLTSFGGPIAHLGYFRDELVQRRAWLNDREYADLVALCQVLPGPASSQVGFGLGLLRAGYGGAVAAFLAFTLPSAALMVAAAFGASLLRGPLAAGLVAGLAVVAVAIVAQAVWGLARSLAPDRVRASIAVVAAGLALALGGSGGQLLALLIGAVAGLALCRADAGAPVDSIRFPVSRRVGLACLALVAALLVALPLLAQATGWGALQLFSAFFRAGSLVFGGGHVVLPLLEAGIVDPGWVGAEQFVAGYGAAQAVPGPLFTFAGYLGALSTTGPGGVAGAAIALAGIFLPGFLLLLGVLPFWNALRTAPAAQAVLRGVGAAVVGILAAALYDPVFTTGVTGPGPFVLALLCFVLLTVWRTPAWAVVLAGAAGGVLLSFLPA
ncbi:MAG: chromate efflux transporter [Herbiconiux sp.]|nr:chromate efflux transporter [Herbiconiux sp.]